MLSAIASSRHIFWHHIRTHRQSGKFTVYHIGIHRTQRDQLSKRLLYVLAAVVANEAKASFVFYRRTIQNSQSILSKYTTEFFS